MPGIFINYRRLDTPGYSGRIYDRLAEHFGGEQVFRDIDRIQPGRDFTEAIDKSVASCDALLVLMGPHWLTLEDENGRRLHDPDDFVRLEVSKALQRDVAVIPILLPGADGMPHNEDLPEDLHTLTKRQAIRVSDETWNHDIDRLIGALESVGVKPREKPAPVTPTPPQAKGGSRKLWFAGGIIATIAAAVMLATQIPDPEPIGPGTVPPDPAEDVIIPPPSRSEQPVTREQQAPQPSESVRTAQSLLSALGYDAGAADGLMGSRTVAAVRAFQADEGLTVNGRVTRDLLDDLQAANDNLSYTPPVYAAPQTAPQVNLAGVWYDNSGVPYNFSHSGNRVVAQAVNQLTGDVLGQLEGTLNGNILDYTYATFIGTTGVGRGTLEPDGQHMTVVVTDSLTGVSQDRMHRGHLPQ